MFGVLTDDEGGSLRGRRFVGRPAFRDVDWAALATASANLTAGVIGAVAQATKGNTQGAYPSSQYQCPAGYVYNPQTATCQLIQPAGTSFFSNIDPTMLLVGGGLLVVLLMRR